MLCILFILSCNVIAKSCLMAPSLLVNIDSKLNQKQKKHWNRWRSKVRIAQTYTKVIWCLQFLKIRELLNLLYARGFGACHLWEQCLKRWVNCPQTSLCGRWFGACNLWVQSLKGFEIPQTSYI